jgi:hypothetical protein
LAFETIIGNSGKYIGDRALGLQRSSQENTPGDPCRGVTEWDTEFRFVTRRPEH